MVLRKCPECGVSVKLENLERHVANVHPGKSPPLAFSEDEQRVIRSTRKKATPGFAVRRSTIVIAVALVLIVAGVVAALPTIRHLGGAFHWHARLTITINGDAVVIPANVGIDPSLWQDHTLDSFSSMQAMPAMGMEGMAPLHTHPDAPGKIHIESVVTRDYTLGEFFRIWGQTFDSQQVLGHVAQAGHRVWMVVDGAETSPSYSLVLRDGMNIAIACG